MISKVSNPDPNASMSLANSAYVIFICSLFGTLYNTFAAVKSVVDDRSTPPIPYLGFNTSRSYFSGLFACSNVSHASDEVSLMLNSFQSRFLTMIGFFLAFSTLSFKVLAFLIVPSPGFAFIQHSSCVHSFRLSNS